MNVLYNILYVFLLALAWAVSPFISKVRFGLHGRVGLNKRVLQARKSWAGEPFWFHVASSGEFEQCLPILEKVREAQPDKPIFLSYFSPSARRAVALETKRRGENPLPWDYADYAPFDLFFLLEEFIAALGPSHFIAVGRELWPNLLQTLNRKKIPSFLFATHFPESNHKLRFFYKEILARFDFIGTVDDVTTHNLVLLLDGDSIQTLGDPRVERIYQRKALGINAPWAPFFEGQRVFVAGSLWPEDFEALKSTLYALSEKGWRLLLVPHEPHGMTESLQSWFETKTLTARLWSHWKHERDNHSHLIVNEIGPLVELYQVASMAFVGGSFRSKVHNVLEPAAYGIRVFTGPRIHNSPQAVELKDRGILIASDTDTDLRENVLRHSKDPHPLAEAEIYFNKRLDSAAKYAEMLT